MLRLLIALVALLGSAEAARADKAKLAVMPLTARGVPEQTVAILDDLLASELDDTGRYEVLGIRDIEAMLGLERMRDALGCGDVTCAVELGGALGVGLLLTGSVGRLGDEVLVQLTLIDTRASKVLRRARASTSADGERYTTAIREAVAGLAGDDEARPPQPTGPVSPVRYRFETRDDRRAFTLEYTSSDGTTVRCKGPVRAESPCMLTRLVLGEGRLNVASEGLDPFAAPLDVDEDDELLVFDVKESPSAGSIISWALGGTAAGIGAALIATGLPTDTDGLVIAGVPMLLIGAGVVVMGFFFDGQVMVDYPSWGLFF